MATDHDRILIEILDAPLEAGTSTQEGFARKERELVGVLSRLCAAASLTLHARLLRCSADDELATKLARLTGDRRARLINYLADAARRAASAKPGNR